MKKMLNGLIVLAIVLLQGYGSYAEDTRTDPSVLGTDHALTETVGTSATSYSWTNDYWSPIRIASIGLILPASTTNTLTVNIVRRVEVREYQGNVVGTNWYGGIETNYYNVVTNTYMDMYTNILYSITTTNARSIMAWESQDWAYGFYVLPEDVVQINNTASGAKSITFNAER